MSRLGLFALVLGIIIACQQSVAQEAQGAGEEPLGHGSLRSVSQAATQWGATETAGTETASSSSSTTTSSSSKADCHALAADLSKVYRQSAPPGPASLTDYLTQSGILLTMCNPITTQCVPTRHQDHVAASWIQRDVTGRKERFFGTLGWVFNATTSGRHIQCVYPTDAASDGRPSQGCGPFQGGSSIGGFQKWQIKAEVENYKASTFGRDTPWESIDCRDMTLLFPNETYPTGQDDDATEDDDATDDDDAGNGANVMLRVFLNTSDCADTLNATTYQYLSLMAINKRVLEDILGHTLCHLRPEDAVAPLHRQPHDWWIYVGDCLWPSTVAGWQEMVQVQTYLQQTFPNISLWNEVVLDKPKKGHDKDNPKDHDGYPALVSAVFYTDSSMYWRALLEARRLKGRERKHLLRMVVDDPRVDDPTVEPAVDLFQCVVASNAVEEAVARGKQSGEVLDS